MFISFPLKEQKAIVKNYYNAAGYYFNDTWRSLSGSAVQQFNDPSAITRCLRGKIVYMLGDSTLRQWYKYLTAFVPGKSWLLIKLLSSFIFFH